MSKLVNGYWIGSNEYQNRADKVATWISLTSSILGLVIFGLCFYGTIKEKQIFIIPALVAIPLQSIFVTIRLIIMMLFIISNFFAIMVIMQYCHHIFIFIVFQITFWSLLSELRKVLKSHEIA